MKKEITFEELEKEFGKDFAKLAMQEIEKEEKEANEMLGTSWYGTTTCDECQLPIKDKLYDFMPYNALGGTFCKGCYNRYKYCYEHIADEFTEDNGKFILSKRIR